MRSDAVPGYFLSLLPAAQTAVLELGGESAAYMTLLFVGVEYFPDLSEQFRICTSQTRRYILMNRTFAYPEYLSRFPYRRFVVYNVMCEAYTSFLFRSC